MKIINACIDCGKLADVNKEKSNEHWIVYDTKCTKCGGKVEMQIK